MQKIFETEEKISLVKETAERAERAERFWLHREVI